MSRKHQDELYEGQTVYTDYQYIRKGKVNGKLEIHARPHIRRKLTKQ